MKKLTCALAALALLIITCVTLMRDSKTSGARQIAPERDTSQSQIASASVLENPKMKPDAESRRRTIDAYGKLPLAFEANRGQVDPQVKFTSRGHGYTVFLASNEVVLSLRPPPDSHETRKSLDPQPSTKPEDKPTVIRMKVLGANERSEVTGIEELGKTNYFIGNKPEEWRSGVPNYARVVYEAIYPGVDLIFHGSNQSQLEYDFVVAPGTDPTAIHLGFEGANASRLDVKGNLVFAHGWWRRDLAGTGRLFQSAEYSRSLSRRNARVTNDQIAIQAQRTALP